MADTFDASSIEESLTKKIGGLPGFAWVGIGVAAVYLYKKYKGGSSSAPVVSTSVTDSSAPADMSTGSLPVGSNAAWASTAANQLMATSSYSPSDIQTALANYQSGNGVTGTQQAIIDSVLHTFGTPPEGVQPVYQAPSTDDIIISPEPPRARGEATNPVTLPPALPIVGSQPSGDTFKYAPPGTFANSGPNLAHAGQINTSLAGSSAKGD
jgi:hypothetical protein